MSGVDGEVAPLGGVSSRDEFGISNGQVDVGNQFRSVVAISSERGFCSGVLLAPRLVLTAAHCFCLPAGGTGGVVDSSACQREATVQSYFYEPVKNRWRPRIDATRGSVTVHPGFRTEVEQRGTRIFIKGRVADLAVVQLEQPLQNVVVESKLQSEEVQLDDTLIVVGYGATAHGARNLGTRRFGENVVSDLRKQSDRKGSEIRFRFPGAHTHNGDSGGPCFREEEGVRWLVGINGGYVSQGGTESWFTSTSSYRDWIEERLAEAQKLESP